MPRRRIHFLSAARSDYDLIATLLAELRRRDRVTVGLIAASAQMSPFHGLGVRQIEEDGIPVEARLETLVAADSWTGRSLSFASLVQALTRQMETNRPDLLFVTGDREEHLAGALVANFLRIPVAHLHGGDRCLASDIDEVMRPAISKLAHFHFTANEGHRERLIRLGEAPERVWAFGAPTLDRLRAEPDLPPGELAAEMRLKPDEPFFLVIQHPSPFLPEAGREEEEMTALLEGVLSLGYPVFCSYPNADPGNVAIRRAIDYQQARHPTQLRVYHNLPRPAFLGLYRQCAAIIGNSSSLVVESGFLRKPAILVGPRQDLREAGDNVVRVGFDSRAVAEACGKALRDREFLERVAQARSPYGDGHSSPRIADILETAELSPDLLLKTMPY